MFLVLVILLILIAPLGAAQTSSPPPPVVIHLWVDPHYGNDLLATQNNPSLTHSTGWKPHDVVDPQQSNAPLLHASWPFKTINGTNGAIKYLQSTTLLNVLPLPNMSSVTGNVWEYAIIHLMPGIYAPGIKFGTVFDTFNGLPENGEAFPIALPDRVSIKGASALNTIIRPRTDTQAVGPAFEFGRNANNSGTGCVIDRVSIYGASRYPTIANPIEKVWNVMGIYMGPQVSCRVTISNCFIFGNEVGICLDADNDPTTPVHQPLIINNTIAWNGIGLWNGQIYTTPSVGVSTPIVINNIFDATPGPSCGRPQWTLQPYGTGGISGFEGLCQEDMRITQPTMMGGETGNFNAFEYDPSQPARKYNLRVTIAPIVPPATGPSLPTTRIRTMNQPTPLASRNIDPYTGGTDPNRPRRGILYVTDLICNGQAHGLFQSGNSTFDRSPMDFRLSPAVTKAGLDAAPPTGKPWVPGGSNGFLNPLVDNGFYYTFPPGVPVQMSNPTRSVSFPPGYLSLQDLGFWPYHSWDEDCEGYGNPRVVDHTQYTPNNGYAPEGEPFTDIGADELGDLIVAGYRHGTTTFIRMPKGPHNTTSYKCNPTSREFDNKYLWYLGRPDAKVGSTPPTWKQKPQHLVVPGVPIGQYKLLPWYDLWTFMPGGVQQIYYGPATTDITPHLPPDSHPWWIITLPPYPSNPLWVPGPSAPYNRFLYVNPSAGVINPPGRHPVAGFQFKWLDGQLPTFQYNCIGLLANSSLSHCNQSQALLGGPTEFSTMDVWCRANDSNTPAPRFMETFTKTGSCKTGNACSATFGNGGCIVSLRYSLEVRFFSTFNPLGQGNGLKNSNIQSFIVIVDPKIIK